MSNSPFPGMDPYLERFWRDVHHRLVTYACDQIQPRLAPELRARMEERVFVTGDEGLIGHRVPDVYVVEYPPRGPVGGTALAVEERVEELVEPFTVPLPEVQLTETYIEIIEASSGNRVVSVIEFLSPTNKLAGDGRREYLRKKAECHQARVPLVDQAYENGRYEDLEYTEPLSPPLDADESAWFQQRLQSFGKHERTRPQ